MNITKKILEKLVKETIDYHFTSSIKENVTAIAPDMSSPAPTLTSGNIGDLLQQLNNLLSMWTESHPDSLAGRYYLDLKTIVDAYEKETTSMNSGIPSSNVPIQ